MDASADDVELVVNRNYVDKDEVYAAEDLYEDEMDVTPVVRRQNRYFIFGIISCIFVVMVVTVVIHIIPKENVAAAKTFDSAVTSDEQGTVSNNAVSNNAKANADHAAKVKEVMSGNANNGHHTNSGHAASALANTTVSESTSAGHNNNNNNNNINKDEGSGEESNHNNTGDNGSTHHANDDHGKNAIHAWHNAKVSKADGVMYEVVEVLKHDPKSFTEGLTFFDGKLYESVGLNKQSAVLVLDPDTGETLETIQMESEYFGEGLTFYDGKLIQLTYKALTGFVYDANDLTKKPQSFQYKTTTNEGWGLTYDPHKNELIVSDGSAFLHFWDPKTFKQIRKHQIMRLDGSKARQINELEFWRGRVVANVWYEHVLLIINPNTGLVEKEYDFSHIWESANVTKNRHAEVFNGISISDDPDILYVTGKWWSNMFKIKLLPLLGDT